MVRECLAEVGERQRHDRLGLVLVLGFAFGFAFGFGSRFGSQFGFGLGFVALT